jgi:hypothetical protein
VFANLTSYGPALISSFSTHTSVEDPYVHSHIGADASEHIGSHAMAVVGWRSDADGNARLLVQTWWKSKQFFECDIAYLASRAAKLSWIKTAITAHVYSTSDSLYAETNLEGEDKDVEEED